MLLNEAVQKFINNLVMTNKSPETIIGYTKELSYFTKFWEDKYNYPPQLEEVMETHIEEYLQFKRDKKLATASIARALNILKSFYKFLCKKRICDTNEAYYLDPIKVVRSKRVFLTCEEFAKVLENTDSELMKSIFITLFNAGLRISELIYLKLDDVDLVNDMLHVFGKGRKYRDLPINTVLHNDLVQYASNRKSDSNNFFATERTGKVSSQYVNACLKEAVKKAGISKKISCHSQRHSFASIILINGGSVQDLRDLLGHESIKTTSIYLHSISENLRRTVNLLNKDTRKDKDIEEDKDE